LSSVEFLNDLILSKVEDTTLIAAFLSDKLKPDLKILSASTIDFFNLLLLEISLILSLLSSNVNNNVFICISINIKSLKIKFSRLKNLLEIFYLASIGKK